MSSLSINDNYYKKLSIGIVILFSVIILLAISSKPSAPIGEIDDYMLPTISLANRASLFFSQADLDQAKDDFPAFYDYLQKEYDTALNGSFSMFIGGDGTPHSWYFPTYSALCIPLKLVFKWMNISQAYAFSITNLLLYVMALLTVILKLRCDDKTVFWLVLLTACNPAVFYINWYSAEVCLFAFVIMSLVYFVNKDYYKAAFWVSLAGTLNATIMIYGSIIFIDYFKHLYATKNFYKNISYGDYTNSVKFLVCFVPVFLPFIYNFYHFSVFSLQCYLDQNTWGYLGYRFLAYLFDLNLGIFPYMPLLFVAFIIVSSIGIVKGDYISCLYAYGFYGTVAAYSIINTLDAAMTGIARYNIWTLPLIIFYLVIYARNIFNYKHIFDLVYFVSAVICTAILLWYGGLFPNRTSSNQMVPLAKVVLEYVPNLYSPFYQTFMTRIKMQSWDKDGWVDRDGQVWLYADDNGYVRKVLATPGNAHELADILYGDDSSVEYLNNEMSRIANLSGRHYLNFPWYVKLRVKDIAIHEKHPYLLMAENSLKDNLVMPSELNYQGKPQMLDGKVYLEKDMACYGPYAPLAKGSYQVEIYGEGLDRAQFDVAYNVGKNNVELSDVEHQTHVIRYKFTLQENVQNIEFRLFNHTKTTMIFEKIKLDKIS